MPMNRRALSTWLALLAVPATGLHAQPGAAPAPDGRPSRAMAFPRDHGSHPMARIEWWYLTGLLRTPGAARPSHGFQLTFFRLRQDLAAPLESAFAPGQLMLGHAAVSDLAAQRLLHDQRLLRKGFAKARASETDTALRLSDWQLRRSDGPQGRSRYQLAMHSELAGFALRLDLQAPQAPLLQGHGGWSRKGPGAAQFSGYVTEPQLAGSGQLALRQHAGASQGRSTGNPPGNQATLAVQARAWLDHEWSDQLLGREDDTQRAVGWDWLGLNLDDGSALTLFQLRRADGTTVWTGGSWRAADGSGQQDFEQQLRFEPLAHWQSPQSLARYPVRWRVHTPRGVVEVQAAFDAQEVDARRSTGFLYWEGVAWVRDATGREIGSGYLEMTGYAGRVPL